ncbi:MAG: double zinc ribbon domain-containing protein [Terriglobia bacterium]
MTCPKCSFANPDTARFCLRCHAPVLFVCPACARAQAHGGKCDQCGVDFAKYAVMLEFQMQRDSRQGRERRKGRNDLVKQALLLPVTGGWSLLRYLRSSLRDE